MESNYLEIDFELLETEIDRLNFQLDKIRRLRDQEVIRFDDLKLRMLLELFLQGAMFVFVESATNGQGSLDYRIRMLTCKNNNLVNNLTDFCSAENEIGKCLQSLYQSDGSGNNETELLTELALKGNLIVVDSGNTFFRGEVYHWRNGGFVCGLFQKEPTRI